MQSEFLSKAKKYFHAHEKAFEVALFIGGFLFDAVMVKEPDEIFALVQQVVYLFIIALILHFELLFKLEKWSPLGRTSQIWKYREIVQPFLLGTLLNVYSIFYIKSASFFSSVIFLAVMVALILANENPTVKKSRVSFKIGLFGICLFSFFSILYPILLGFVGWTPFFLTVVTTAGLFGLQFVVLQKKIGDRQESLRAIVWPALSVLVFFVLFYIMGWIPPVPLSVKEQGIYHDVKKENGNYILTSQKEWWRFWNAGDEYFVARPGDRIFYYFQIYSPAGFSDGVVVHWFWKNPKGHWESSDKVPVKITGGRKEGFRGVVTKGNFQPGSWRVQVESGNGLEISRHYFEVHTNF
jgi:hypothetical protein